MQKGKFRLGLWAKRLLVYFLGLFIMAVGVVFSVRSALGVSPVTCLANVTYQIFGVDMGISALSLGVCTTLTYCVYILVEIVILGRNFKPTVLLQIVASTIFGMMVTLATKVFGFLPYPESYPMRMLFLLCSIPLVAVGVMLYLAPNILPTPGEGLSLAVSMRIGKPVASCKTITDCCMVVVSTLVSLIYFHGLVGVREGTVICALLVGVVLRQMQKACQPRLLKFVERESKMERAIQAAAGGYRVDATGKPKIVIAIGREFGSGGYEVGQKLAQRLGVTFYDQQLIEVESRESGLSVAEIQEMEKHMARELAYDWLNANYAMSNDELPPAERLFAAQTAIIRNIAAGDESCVIVGRCADYILYDDPNCFRIFIHARPSARIDRIMKQFDCGEAEAAQQMNCTDTARARHYKHFTGRNYGSQQYYHLAVDSGQIGVDGTVDVIMDSIRLWCDLRGTHPLSALVEKETV